MISNLTDWMDEKYAPTPEEEETNEEAKSVDAGKNDDFTGDVFFNWLLFDLFRLNLLLIRNRLNASNSYR